MAVRFDSHKIKMITIIVFVIILGFLIFVHELGHFVTARRNGIRTKEFGFGFPPRAVGVQFLYKDAGRKQKNIKKPFRIIWGSKDGDDAQEQKDLAQADKEGLYGGTVYSLNWIPIGGFVKIKGEDGEHRNEKDSFSAKSPWTRIKVLGAGVAMNFLIAWIFFSVGFMLGTPQEVSDKDAVGAKIMIISVEPNSPAAQMGIVEGDIVLTQQSNYGESIELKTVKDMQEYVANLKGREISLKIRRGTNEMIVMGTPRAEAPKGEGLLGVGLAQVKNIKYSFFESFFKGLEETWSVVLLTFGFITQIFVGNKEVIKGVSGIVGIAKFTGNVIPLGLSALARFIAMLSVNLAVLNILPIPALDGGRIIFVLIEKIKGSPVNEKMEQLAHTIGFALLMVLMVWVTYRDIARIFG